MRKRSPERPSGADIGNPKRQRTDISSMTPERQFLSAADPKAYADAIERLLTQLRDDPLREALFRGITAHANAVSEGRPSKPPQAVGVILALALLHVTMGIPLFITDQLLTQWQEQRDSDPIRECPVDGYRMPRQHDRCPVCGADAGPSGCWARARAEKAPLN